MSEGPRGGPGKHGHGQLVGSRAHIVENPGGEILCHNSTQKSGEIGKREGSGGWGMPCPALFVARARCSCSLGLPCGVDTHKQMNKDNKRRRQRDNEKTNKGERKGRKEEHNQV